jgi:6-carboxyhexanoate--CoA ligase
MFQSEEQLFCIRVAAEKNSSHVSGHDRLGTYDEIFPIAQELLAEAVASGQGTLEKISLEIEALKHFDVGTARLPDLISIPVKDYREARKIAQKILGDAGVSSRALDSGFRLLTRTYGQGGVSLPGAVLIDSFTGTRLDGDRNTWIGRVDLTERLREEIRKDYEQKVFRIKEWLILSAKILALPGMVAELTMSNEKSNPCGWVSTPELGAMHLSAMRANQNEIGGRILFVRSSGFDLDKATRFLEHAVFLIDTMGKIR